jgi:hypothetical protein
VGRSIGRRYRECADRTGVELDNILDEIDEAVRSRATASEIVEAAAHARRGMSRPPRNDHA